MASAKFAMRDKLSRDPTPENFEKIESELERLWSALGQFAGDTGDTIGDQTTGPSSSTDGNLAEFDGTDGKTLADSGVAAADVVQGPSASVADEVALYDGTTGKLIKRASQTGRPKLTAGVLSVGAIDLATGDVTGRLPFANLAQIAGLSVLGVTGNALADVAAITAANDAEVLRRSGTSLAFGTVATAGIADAAVTLAKLANLTNQRVIGRNTAGSGVPEEVTLSQLLDWISGSVAQGDILFRGSAGWSRLAAGTSGQFLETQGAGADPQWGTPAGGASAIGVAHTQLTNTQIGSLLSTPVDVVSAGGSGIVRAPIACVVITNIAVGYGSATTCNLRWSGDSNNLSGSISGITSTTGKHISVTTGTYTTVGASSVYDNKAIVIRAGANPTGGDAANVMDVYTVYLEETIP